MRMIVLFAEDTAASEDLIGALDLIQGPNYLPYPDDSTPADRRKPQPRMTKAQANVLALEFLHRAITRVHIGAQAIVPEAASDEH